MDVNYSQKARHHSPVLVAVSSKSVFIWNRLHAKLVDISRNRIF